MWEGVKYSEEKRTKDEEVSIRLTPSSISLHPLPLPISLALKGWKGRGVGGGGKGEYYGPKGQRNGPL